MTIMTKKLAFASFWAGPQLSPFERACVSSFVRRGYQFTLYSYERYDNLPVGVELKDASLIADRRDLELFVYDGRPDLSHFSDLFRYQLFATTQEIWVDTDMFLLRDFDTALPRMIIAKEHNASLCGAIMRLDPAEIDLARIIAKVRGFAGDPIRWGATGPLLLTKLYGRSALFERAYDPSIFYPVLYDVFWKVFLPEHREECEELCRRAYTLHLWNNIVVQLGVWKNIAPPAGSYAHEVFAEANQLQEFESTYPAEIMRRMIENWRLRFSGNDVGIGNLVRQLVPGALRTARRRGWLAPVRQAAR